MDANLRAVVNERDAARHVGLSAGHLRRMRGEGKSPRFVRLSERRIGYRLADLNAWLESRVSGGDQPSEAA